MFTFQVGWQCPALPSCLGTPGTLERATLHVRARMQRLRKNSLGQKWKWIEVEMEDDKAITLTSIPVPTSSHASLKHAQNATHGHTPFPFSRMVRGAQGDDPLAPRPSAPSNLEFNSPSSNCYGHWGLSALTSGSGWGGEAAEAEPLAKARPMQVR